MANPYTDITEFTNTIMGNPFALYDEDFTREEMLRINKEIMYWRFYRGQQWSTKRITGEPQNTVNYCRAFVDKGVSFLMGKGFSIKVKSDANEITKPFLDEVWDDNNRELVALDIAQAGGVTGNAWAKVVVEEFDEDELPFMKELYPNGRVRIIILPTYTVFPTWHAHDRDKMVKCKIVYPIMVENVRIDGSVSYEEVWYKEEITSEYIKEYMDGNLIEERENLLREIPVVRIKNLPLAGEPLGMSDLQDIIPLQKELNYKSTDISDIINYHAAPITVIIGAKGSNLEKGARKIWSGLPKDASVFNLELKGELKAASDYLDFIKTSMFELAHMPEDAFGKKLNISNTSGVALHIKNQPLMELTRSKNITYGEGIRQINKLILRYGELIDHPGLDVGKFNGLKPAERYWTKIEFPDPLPKDELIQMQLIAQKIALYLLSRKDAMAQLGETEAEEKLDKILEETMMIQDKIYDAQSKAEESLRENIGGVLTRDEKVKPDNEDDE